MGRDIAYFDKSSEAQAELTHTVKDCGCYRMYRILNGVCLYLYFLTLFIFLSVEIKVLPCVSES